MRTIIKYIREPGYMVGEKYYNGKPIGVIVALNEKRIGISLCNKKDRWNKKIGIEKALDRAKYGDYSLFLHDIPSNEKLKRNIFNNLDKVKETLFKLRTAEKVSVHESISEVEELKEI